MALAAALQTAKSAPIDQADDQYPETNIVIDDQNEESVRDKRYAGKPPKPYYHHGHYGKPQSHHHKPESYHHKPESYHHKPESYHHKPESYHHKPESYHVKPVFYLYKPDKKPTHYYSPPSHKPSSDSCTYWCRDGRRFYCCDDNPLGYEKPGYCPVKRPFCPHKRAYGKPELCTNDYDCGGTDKCCEDACITEKVCKPAK